MMLADLAILETFSDTFLENLVVLKELQFSVVEFHFGFLCFSCNGINSAKGSCFCCKTFFLCQIVILFF